MACQAVVALRSAPTTSVRTTTDASTCRPQAITSSSTTWASAGSTCLSRFWGWWSSSVCTTLQARQLRAGSTSRYQMHGRRCARKRPDCALIPAGGPLLDVIVRTMLATPAYQHTCVLRDRVLIFAATAAAGYLCLRYKKPKYLPLRLDSPSPQPQAAVKK